MFCFDRKHESHVSFFLTMRLPEVDIVMQEFSRLIDTIDKPALFLAPEPQPSQALPAVEEIKEMHWTQKTLSSALLKKCAAVLLDLKPNNEGESDHDEYSWLALVTVEDAAQFRVKVLNVGSKVVYLADALLQKSQKKMSALLYFPIDERYPREVEEFRLAPCRVMHLHAAHVNLEWQNIHTEQFEPRLRRYVRSQLNTRIAEQMFNPMLQMEGAQQGTTPYNVQDDIMVARDQMGYINKAQPSNDFAWRQHVSAEQRAADGNVTWPLTNTTKRAKRDEKPMAMQPWMAKLLSASWLGIAYFIFRKLL